MGNEISKTEYESVKEMLLMEIRDLKAQIREKDQLIDTLRMMNYVHTDLDEYIGD